MVRNFIFFVSATYGTEKWFSCHGSALRIYKRIFAVLSFIETRRIMAPKNRFRVSFFPANRIGTLSCQMRFLNRTPNPTPGHPVRAVKHTQTK
jgi:hypothetical protein